MFKKIGISLLLAFAMLVSTFNVRTATPAYATPTCTTIAECREIEQAARDNIAEILEEEDELRTDIAEIQGEISALRDEIADLEERISGLNTEIADLEREIADLALEILDLADEIDTNLGILDETEDRIDVLVDEISQRMRLTQRANNRNSFLVMLSEAENLTTFLRVTRTFNRIASDDAELMDELTELVEFQENLLLELGQQQEELETNRDIREASRNTLETRVSDLGEEQANFETIQTALVLRETELQDMLGGLNENRMTEEEMLAMATEMQEILERTPPPPAPGTGTSSNNSSGSGTSSGTQIPSASGLAHPLPGARATSHFGLRNGRHHAGVDLQIWGDFNAPILAAASGTVTLAGWHNSMGNWVIISHNINGQQVDTVYAHLSVLSVSAGDPVSQGDVIGNKGTTGFTFSNGHLHFEVHPGGFAWGQNRGVNPCGWISC